MGKYCSAIFFVWVISDSKRCPDGQQRTICLRSLWDPYGLFGTPWQGQDNRIFWLAICCCFFLLFCFWRFSLNFPLQRPLGGFVIFHLQRPSPSILKNVIFRSPFFSFLDVFHCFLWFFCFFIIFFLFCPLQRPSPLISFLKIQFPEQIVAKARRHFFVFCKSYFLVFPFWLSNFVPSSGHLLQFSHKK